MPEIWLHANRRALTVALGLALFLLAAGGSAIALGGRIPWGIWLQGAGILTVLCSAYMAVSLLYQRTLPRLAYERGYLVVYLNGYVPQRVPIEVVELFFAGQGDSHVALAPSDQTRSRTVVVRLAEAATEWHARPTRPAWGLWREGYIIVRGTWCEPLSPEVFQQLNRRLAEVHRDRRAQLSKAQP